MALLLPSLSILIPAYNDEQTIGKTVLEAYKVGRKCTRKLEIIVLNDASPDNTGKVLETLRKKIPVLKILKHTINGGYGAAIKDLYYAGKNEWLFTTPGDYQIPPQEILKLIKNIGKADMVIGWRVKRRDPPNRLRQSRIYNTLLRVLYDISLKDINSVRLMKRPIMENIALTTKSAFVDAELTIMALKKGYRVIEVPISHKAREVGEVTAGGGKLKTILPVIKDMLIFRLKSLI